MKDLPPLEDLSSEEKDALIKGLWQELQALPTEVEKLKQNRVKKTSHNSSPPSAKGFKPNQEITACEPDLRQASVCRKGDGRELSEHPDQVVVAHAKSRLHCGAEAEAAEQQLKGIYERIELPLVRPQVLSGTLRRHLFLLSAGLSGLGANRARAGVSLR